MFDHFFLTALPPEEPSIISRSTASRSASTVAKFGKDEQVRGFTVAKAMSIDLLEGIHSAVDQDEQKKK